MRRAARARHARSRNPRGHWLLLAVLLPVMFVALFFEGWTTHAVDAATTRRPCTQPVPQSVADGGPVLRMDGARTESVRMPPHTVALTFDGGPDPV